MSSPTELFAANYAYNWQSEPELVRVAYDEARLKYPKGELITLVFTQDSVTVATATVTSKAEFLKNSSKVASTMSTLKRPADPGKSWLVVIDTCARATAITSFLLPEASN